MRLPADATLLLGEGADPALEAVWREERLPIAPIAGAAELDALDTATVVVAGAGAAEAAALAASLGFRTFVVDAAALEARTVTAAEAVEAARNARARERWKAARAV